MSWLKTAKRRARRELARRPRVYLAYRGIRRPDATVTRDTELVIEGYPHSGNTFAYHAFRVAQPGPVRVAHHSHAPAQVLAAASWRVPTLVLVREPTAAVRSRLRAQPGLGAPEELFADYLWFYDDVMVVRPWFVLASFEAATRRLGAVVRCINSRFGTSFTEFPDTEAARAAAFASMDAHGLARWGETRARANPRRTAEDHPRWAPERLDGLDALLADDRIGDVKDRAQAAYARLADDADVT